MRWIYLNRSFRIPGRLIAVVTSIAVILPLTLSVGAVADNDLGAFDPQFNAAGPQPGVIEGLPAGEASNMAVAIQPDGKIVVAATFVLEETPFLIETNLVVTRLNPDGTLDRTFNAGGPLPGEREISFGEGTYVRPDVIHVDNDGRIVVLGEGGGAAHNYSWAIASLNSDGTLDTSFNPNGTEPGTEMLNDGTEDPLTQVITIGKGAVTGEGKILLEGATETAGSGLIVKRLNADGSVDTTFNANGRSPGEVVVPVSEIGSAYSIAVQNDGTIDAAFGISDGRGRVDRISADGSSVLWSTNVEYGNRALQVLPLTGGGVDVVQGGGVAQYTPQGSLNKGFGNQGFADEANCGSGGGSSLSSPAALGPNELIVIAGPGDFSVVRFTSDGELDTTFDPGGVTPGGACTPIGGDVYGVAVQADEKIVAVGIGLGGGAVVRYLADTTVEVPPPTTVTERASPVSQATATLNATVNPNGQTVSDCHFEYGTTESYEAGLPCASLPGSGASPVAISASLSGLSANTTYHVRIVATSRGGTSYGGDQTFKTLPNSPTVTGVSPGAGLESGGTSVTITGTELAEATAVMFGSASAISFTVNSPTSITAVDPQGTGTVDVTVTTAGGTSVTGSADHFSYVPSRPPPKVTELSPKKGPAAGGTLVAIAGTGFTGVTAVRFGTLEAASFTVNSATSITAVSPAATTGTVEVTVITPNGTSTSLAGGHFTFEAPFVLRLSPSAGSIAGGATVTVTGSGFGLGGTATLFRFGNVLGAAVNCTSTTVCTVVTPARTRVGVVDVRAIVAGKISSKNPSLDQFAYR